MAEWKSGTTDSYVGKRLVEGWKEEDGEENGRGDEMVGLKCKSNRKQEVSKGRRKGGEREKKNMKRY